jgi:hypothetical protein
LRRIFLVLAMLALLVLSAMPAIAQNWGNDDWGDDNDNNWWDGGNDWGDDNDNDWGDDDSQPSEPSCDWYEAGFDVGSNAPEWWGYWCHWPGSGWYLIAWWSDATGYISAW